MMLRALLYSLFATVVSSTASGYDTWTCRPSQHNTPYTVSGQNAPFFSLRLLNSDGSTANGYTPGLTQTVELYAVATGAKIAGVVAAAFTGTTICPTSCNTVVGSFSAPTGVSYLRQMSRCTGGMTQSSRQSLSSFKFSWTAPSAQTIPVSVWAVVVGAGDTYVAVSSNFTQLVESVGNASNTPTPIASTSPTSTIVEVVPSTSSMPRAPSNTSTPLPSPSRVRTPSTTPSVTPVVSSVVNPSPSSSPVAVAPSSSPAPPPTSTSSSRAYGLGGNYNPPTDSSTTSSALSNAAVILASFMAVLVILCMIYHYCNKSVKKSKQPITITTNMPGAVSSSQFYKRTDGKDVWYVDSKTMESSWSLPRGAVIITEEV